MLSTRKLRVRMTKDDKYFVARKERRFENSTCAEWVSLQVKFNMALWGKVM